MFKSLLTSQRILEPVKQSEVTQSELWRIERISWEFNIYFSIQRAFTSLISVRWTESNIFLNSSVRESFLQYHLWIGIGPNIPRPSTCWTSWSELCMNYEELVRAPSRRGSVSVEILPVWNNRQNFHRKRTALEDDVIGEATVPTRLPQLAINANELFAFRKIFRHSSLFLNCKIHI